MEALTFFNKKLDAGDKVRLTLETGKVLEGYFGGYKCFDGVTAYLEYHVYPVFYRPGKKGQYVKRSLFGTNRSTFVGFSEIKDVEKIKEDVQYRHIGYYNNPEDCYNLAMRGHKVALQAWKRGEGEFVNVDNEEPFDDIENDDETRILENGIYAFRISDCIADSNGDDYSGYIDIFERVDNAA